MKKLSALLLALCLCFSGGLAETAETSADAPEILPSLWEDGQLHRIERKTFPLYAGSAERPYLEEFPVYLVDGAEDLPYLDLKEFGPFFGKILSGKEREEESSISVTVDEDSGIVTFLRKTRNMIAFNFKEKQIVWTDYLAFNQAEGALYMNMLRGVRYISDDGQPQLFEIGNVRERHGRSVILDLKKYGIPMLAQDGKYLVPMQTLSAFCLGTESVSLYFNQECVILVTPQQFDAEMLIVATVLALQDEMEKIQKMDLSDEEKQARMNELALQKVLEEPDKSTLFGLYVSGPKGERSAALTDYGWHELCLEMDSMYGLKETHDIDTFLAYFTETGLLSGLVSRSAEEADQAVWSLTKKWLDDGHSNFFNRSYLAGKTPDSSDLGFTKATRTAMVEKLTAIRSRYPAAIPGYYETGDTAFVTLDNFSFRNDVDHYALDREGNLPTDTVGIIVNAHRQITRENSPVKNVVLDLSLNTGGANPAAVFLISWVLGEAQLSVKDTFSGAETTAAYRTDVNLDRVFDEQDTLAGRGLRLFCLTSPVSFSCGNLVPWAFKAEGTVKLMGSITGGGSCAVWPMTTAWGTSFAISGPFRISFLKNGAYYDVDQGVEPDYVISSYDRYYDREALAEYISTLY